MTDTRMTIPANQTYEGVARAIEGLDVQQLRDAIQTEYTAVAMEPDRGFHFHTGRRLAGILGYQPEWLDGVPESTIASFAGTGNPFSIGPLAEGERVVDVGCGAGIDSLIAAKMVGPAGSVAGIDMTPAMLDRARAGAWGSTSARVALATTMSGRRRWRLSPHHVEAGAFPPRRVA